VPRRVEETDHYYALSERDLKTNILTLASRMGWAVYHVPMTNMRNGGGRGYPDLTLARDGEVLWMELKTQVGLLTREQGMWMEALPSAHIIRPIDWFSGRVAELLA
jgi:hypothetical protein